MVSDQKSLSNGCSKVIPTLGEEGRCVCVCVCVCVWLTHLGEESACDKLFVLQEGDSLATVQLLSQVCHICLQLCKAWRDTTGLEDNISPSFTGNLVENTSDDSVFYSRAQAQNHAYVST
jgi:hypothetical protein